MHVVEKSNNEYMIYCCKSNGLKLWIFDMSDYLQLLSTHKLNKEELKEKYDIKECRTYIFFKHRKYAQKFIDEILNPIEVMAKLSV